jgi:azurin
MKLLSSLILFVTLALSCAIAKDKAPKGNESVAKDKAPKGNESAAKDKAPQEVVISGNDTMQFDVKSFEVKAGSKVKLTFKNMGQHPKIIMGHNLVLLKKGVTAVAFGQKALGAGANFTNPLPDSLKGDVIAHTKLLGPAESDTIEFTAPKEPGAYEYVCTFPAHFVAMRGTMTVK